MAGCNDIPDYVLGPCSVEPEKVGNTYVVKIKPWDKVIIETEYEDLKVKTYSEVKPQCVMFNEPQFGSDLIKSMKTEFSIYDRTEKYQGKNL